MRVRLSGLNPARGAKLTAAPRPGLLCRCQKVNLPGSPATLRVPAGPRLSGRAEAEGAGRLPPIHPVHSLYGGRPAPPASCTGRPAPSRPPHSSCAPAAARPVQRRPPRHRPRPRRPIASPLIYIRRQPCSQIGRGGRQAAPPSPPGPAPSRAVRGERRGGSGDTSRARGSGIRRPPGHGHGTPVLVH